MLLRATLGVCLITNLIPLYMLLGMRNKWEIYLLFVVAGLVVFRHRANLVRLRQGREGKLGEGSSEASAPPGETSD